MDSDSFYESSTAIINSCQAVFMYNYVCVPGYDTVVDTLVRNGTNTMTYAKAQTVLGGDTQLPEFSSTNYILPNSDRRYLNEGDVAYLTNEQLRLARNEIYARYNCLFTDSELREYFSKFGWYDGWGCYARDLELEYLNEYEQYNLNLIIAAENNTSPDYVYTAVVGENHPANAYGWITQESQDLTNPFLYIIVHQYGLHSEGDRDLYVLDAGDQTVMASTIATYDDRIVYYGGQTTANHGGSAYSIWRSPNGLCAIESSYKWGQNSADWSYYAGGKYITNEDEVKSLLASYGIPEDLVPYNSLEQ